MSDKVHFGSQEPPVLKEPEEPRAANHGILDPAEPGHRLPEGLERERKGPLPQANIEEDFGT